MADTVSAVTPTAEARSQAPGLFVGLSATSPTAPPAMIALSGLDEVRIERGERRVERTGRSVVVGLDDPHLSQRHARLVRDGAAWWLEDLESKNGSWHDGRRIAKHRLADDDVIVVGHTAMVFRLATPDDGTTAGLRGGLRTLSAPFAVVLATLAAAAATAVTIEIRGETGTGKELVARAAHALSRRRGDFVAVNCGAIPSALVEAELFGHKRGAFTGAADDRLGYLRSADRGTLFLDEVAELPLPSQAALLRALQESEVTPVGADRPIAVDLRVVTATHRDLDEAVAAGTFRADLRARLLGVQLDVPSLRERREDLGLIVGDILARRATRVPALSLDAVMAIYAYDWPLNVRELERALTAAVAVSGDRIELAHLPAAVRDAFAGPALATPVELSPADRELHDRLVASIDRHAGNLTAVARELRKDRTQVRRWMKRFGIAR